MSRAAPVRVAWRLTGCGGRHGHLGPPAGDGAEVPEDIPAAVFTLEPFALKSLAFHEVP